MAELVVSAVTGALKPLLGKLEEEYKRYKGVPGEISTLTKELEAMSAYLVKMSEVENPDVQDEACMKEVRELSYDMEDCVDEFLLRIGHKADTPDGIIPKFKNIIPILKDIIFTKPEARRRIAKVIEKLKIQVKEMGERNARYKTLEIISKTSSARVDRRALAIFGNLSNLVGLDRPKKELIDHLTKKEGLNPSQPPKEELIEEPLTEKDGLDLSQPRKVISIVGSGGLGKTTLANQVYQELKGEFECHAFVSVSRNPDSLSVLQNILCQLSNEPHHNIQAWNMQSLIMIINDALRDKRYLIVIDDLWTKDEAWNAINCALYKNDKGSKIITTTRMYDVAKACCSSYGDFVYEIRPLGREDSENLFYERLFGSKYKCPTHLKQISDKILEKCDGLPLAIISISGLLATKAPTEDEWGRVQNSIGRGLPKNSDVKSMMQILSLSYFDLPHYLKTCLLYLSVFPEDSIIDKKRLVRRWIAEGFIAEEQGKTLYELGERCFNELINRSLIQARNIMYGEVTACQVHDIILDFIVSKSEEENFISVFGDGYQMHGQHSKVRRLSINASSRERVSTLNQLDLSHVRSVTVLHYSFELPLWTKFCFLRVLDLHGCGQVEGHHLTDIGNLFQLKYLSLRETEVCELPKQICQLTCLETLDLMQTKLIKLPSYIAQLQGLVYLAVDKGVKLPDETEKMTALEDLDCVDIFKQSVNFPKKLEQLKNLRNIRLFLRSDNCIIPAEGSHYKEYMNDIASSLCKLSHLHSLSIDVDRNSTEDYSLDSGGDAPTGLHIFEITSHYISKVPNWVRSLLNIRVLTLYVKKFEVDDVMALGRLPALVFLRLVAHESFNGRRITISGADGFQSLHHFDYGCAMPLTFEAGAMPKLEKLKLMLSSLKIILLVVHENFRFGIEHLISLHSVDFLVHYCSRSVCTWIAEKETQIVRMSCELAKVEIDYLEGTLRTMENPTGIFEIAAGTHLNSITLRGCNAWRIERGGYKFRSRKEAESSRRRFFTKLQDLFSKARPVLKDARYMLENVKWQVNERIKNCPLQGNGNCQCQGRPE